MSETGIMPRHAWQPFTPRGAAAFAVAPVGRLLLIELLVALFAAGMLAWFVSSNWFSVVRQAVGRLPETAAIKNGRLEWGGDSPVRLAENRFLALVVDVQGQRTLGKVADLEIRLHESRLAVASLLGYVDLPYPTNRAVNLARSEAIPWWGAWEGPILAMFMGATVLSLMASWLALSTLYCPFIWAIGFFANRRLGLAASWKLCGAALMPAAMMVVLGVFCYGWIGLDLIQLAFVYVLHFVAGWSLVLASLFFLPKVQSGASAGNPFASQEAGEEKKSAPKQDNPFRPPS